MNIKAGKTYTYKRWLNHKDVVEYPVDVVGFNGDFAIIEDGNGEREISIDYLFELEDEPQKPAHYDTGIDTIAFLRANCPPEQVEGFLRGNALKYLQRYDKKNGVEDLRKAKHYVEILIEEVEERA